MELDVVVQSIATISFMIIIGALISKTFPFNEDTRSVFISLIVNVAMPCIILASIFNVTIDKNTFNMIIFVFCASIAVNLIGIGLGWGLSFLFFRNSDKKNELALLSGLGNTGFIGIPLCAVLLGPEGALYAAIFDAGLDFTIWTVGILMLQRNKSSVFGSLKSMINIPMISIILGLFISYIQFTPPTIVINLVNQLAALAAPLAMFYIGVLIMTIQHARIKKTGTVVWLPITIKLLILPSIVAVLIAYFKMELFIFQTIMIQTMMPTITLASILFAKYSADEEIGATTTVLSTIFALITIPFLIYMMNLFLVN